MSDSDIQLDDDPTIEKKKSAAPLLMAILVIVAFICLTATLALQFMEYQYFRGGSNSETDTYASQVLIPQG